MNIVLHFKDNGIIWHFKFKKIKLHHLFFSLSNQCFTFLTFLLSSSLSSFLRYCLASLLCLSYVMLNFLTRHFYLLQFLSFRYSPFSTFLWCLNDPINYFPFSTILNEFKTAVLKLQIKFCVCEQFRFSDFILLSFSLSLFSLPEDAKLFLFHTFFSLFQIIFFVTSFLSFVLFFSKLHPFLSDSFCVFSSFFLSCIVIIHCIIIISIDISPDSVA